MNTFIRANVVRVDAVLAEGVAVIARYDYRRLFQDPLAVQLFQDDRDLAVHVRNGGVIAGNHFFKIPARRDARVTCTVTVLPGDVWRFADVLTNPDIPDIRNPVGSIRIRFVVEPLVSRMHIAIDTDDLPAAARMITRLRSVAESLRGHLMIRRAAPELKKLAGVWGTLDPPVVRLMERLKQTFDPDRRLSPGRFVAGL